MDNPIYRYYTTIQANGKTYKADYEAAKQRHEKGIYGGRVVYLLLWEGSRVIANYNRGEWVREPQDAEGRSVMRRILEKVR